MERVAFQVVGDDGDPRLPHFFCLRPEMVAGPDFCVQRIQAVVQIMEHAMALRGKIAANGNFVGGSRQPLHRLRGKKPIEDARNQDKQKQRRKDW